MELQPVLAFLHRTLIHGSCEVERGLCGHHPGNMLSVLHIMLYEAHAVLIPERGDQRFGALVSHTTNTLPKLVVLGIADVTVLTANVARHVGHMEHAVRLGGQQVALVEFEIVDRLLEVPADFVTAWQTLMKGATTLGVVVAVHHHQPRGIVTDTANELEDGSGIADGSYYLFVDHTLLELRVATSMGHHSQKNSSEWQAIVIWVNGLNWVAVLIYLWRKWGCVSGLLLRRGLLCHRLTVRLLCYLILRLAHALDLVEAQVINDGCRAVLFRELSRLVPESASYLHSFLQIVDHLGVECLQQNAVGIAVTVMLKILKNKWQRFPFVARALAHTLSDGQKLCDSSLKFHILLFELKSTHQASQQPTDIQYTEKCDAKNGTEANLTQDVLYFLIVNSLILFHIYGNLKVSFYFKSLPNLAAGQGNS